MGKREDAFIKNLKVKKDGSANLSFDFSAHAGKAARKEVLRSFEVLLKSSIEKTDDDTVFSFTPLSGPSIPLEFSFGEDDNGNPMIIAWNRTMIEDITADLDEMVDSDEDVLEIMRECINSILSMEDDDDVPYDDELDDVIDDGFDPDDYLFARNPDESGLSLGMLGRVVFPTHDSSGKPILMMYDIGEKDRPEFIAESLSFFQDTLASFRAVFHDYLYAAFLDMHEERNTGSKN